MTIKRTTAAFGVIDKDSTLWPAAAATQEGMYMTLAELFGYDPDWFAKHMNEMGYKIIPVIITEVS